MKLVLFIVGDHLLLSIIFLKNFSTVLATAHAGEKNKVTN